MRDKFVGATIFTDPLFDTAGEAREVLTAKLALELLLQVVAPGRGEGFERAVFEILPYLEVQCIEDETASGIVDHPAYLDRPAGVDHRLASFVQGFFHRKWPIKQALVDDAAASHNRVIFDDNDEFGCTIVAIAFQAARFLPFILLRENLIAETVEALRQEGVSWEGGVDDHKPVPLQTQRKTEKAECRFGVCQRGVAQKFLNSHEDSPRVEPGITGKLQTCSQNCYP